MQRHPYFDLWLHEDTELAELLGSPVSERTTLHEWPLSCVQRLRLADGRTRIYKAQALPTIEPAFYASARSPLLVNARILAVADGPPALLFEDLVGPRLADLQLREEEALRHGTAILDAIGQIADVPPTGVDIRTEAQWAAYAETMLANLNALVEEGSFQRVSRSLIAKLARTMESPAVLAAICSPAGLVHRDLSGDNVFLLPDGYRVIDWQRPILGPVALDLANLLAALGFDPLQHVAPGVVQLLYLLRIDWLAQCARTWFTPGAASYDTTILRHAARVRDAGK
jgi:hypothetical protein